MIAALMLVAVQAATPTPPAPPRATGEDRTVVREIIVRDAPDGSAAAKGSNDKVERREILIVRSGDKQEAGQATDRVRILRSPGTHGEHVALKDCDSGSRVDSEATDKDGKKTRVMICATGGSDAARTQRLREAAKRIQADTNLSEETRNRIAVAINEAIARLPVSE